MQIQNDRSCWRTSFLGGLQLLGQAAARLPFGVQDPVVVGSSAVELYTGGIWEAPNLEVLTPHPQALTAELFAAGFRWCQRLQQGPAGLWHRDLGIGLEIIDPSSMRDVEEPANRLVVAIDLHPFRSADAGATSLIVVGIEDLIAQQLGRWLADGARSGEYAIRVQALVGLGREGVGGPLRDGYLRRRVASVSDDQVVLDLPTSDEGMARGYTCRATNLTQMAILIGAWRARNGLISTDRRTPCSQTCDRSESVLLDPQPRRVPRRAGGPKRTSAQIVPFDVSSSSPPR